MKMVIESKVVAWLRGLVWAAMIAGCAWASAQSYLVQPASGHYKAVAMGQGAGVGLGEGIGAEGAQNSESLPKDDLFAGTEGLAKNATHVTEITMDPDSLNMVGGRDGAKAHSMVLNVVRTYEYDKPGMYNMADVDAIRNKLNSGDWRCSVHVRDLKTGEGQDICSKHRTDGLKEEAIIEVEPKELTLIHRIWRPGGPGSSELGFFPMMPGLGPMAMMAMTNPEALADMEIGLHGLPMMLNLEPGLNLQMNELKVHPFDQQQMRQLQDQLRTLKVKPLDPEQMEKMNKQMKDFKFYYKGEGAEAPVVPETPETPVTPETAPTPVTPQTAPTPAAPAPPQ
jgi:hypothetical protein